MSKFGEKNETEKNLIHQRFSKILNLNKLINIDISTFLTVFIG